MSVQPLHSATSWTQHVERLDQPLHSPGIPDRTVICLGRRRKVWEVADSERMRKWKYVFANATAHFFLYRDGIFNLVLEWGICITVLGDYGDI